MYVATRLISNPLKGIYKADTIRNCNSINEGMVNVWDGMVQGKGSMGGGIVRSSGWGQGVEGLEMVVVKEIGESVDGGGPKTGGCRDPGVAGSRGGWV